MPELPEIETVKLQLQKYLVGQVMVRLKQLHKKSVIGEPKLVEGKKVTGVRRFGKMLVIDLSGSLHIAIHFKMSGQLILIQNSKFKNQNDKSKFKNRIAGGHPTQDWVEKLPSKHTRAIFHFKSGDKMYFNDQRIFGWIRILDSKSLKELRFLKVLGKEPWDLTDEEFYELMVRRKKAVKLVLMDQGVLSGVGNIYANDGLWEARIHPKTEARILSYKDTKILRASVIKVLREGIKYGGATAADAKYINLDRLGGHYQEHFRVYDREGEKCLRNDGGVIKKIVLGGRGTYFCPVCQKSDK